MLVIFVLNRRAFGLFNNKVEVAALRLVDVSECLPGAELRTDSDPNLLLTIICKDQRFVVLKFLSRDERNVMLSKIRYAILNCGVPGYFLILYEILFYVL